MNRYKLTIEYLGSNFCGWQRQKNSITVQEVLETAAKNFFQHNVVLFAAGRTDAGVHAEGQVAHLDTENKYDSERVLYGINFFLDKEVMGKDIRVKKVKKVSVSFNARFSAKKKIYRYNILNSHYKSPIFSYNTWWVSSSLNLEKMIKAAEILKGRHDFSSFRAKGCQAKSPIKTLDNIKITKRKSLIQLTFTAKSFLYNQVRIMVGTLKDVGNNLIEPDDLRYILTKKLRKLSGVTAPAKGLTLLKVLYK